MDTAQLILRVEGTDNAGELDVAPLQDAFEVLDIGTASQINIINGQMRSWVEHRVDLRPKRTGVLEIPALAIGSQSSPPLRLQVNPLGADVRTAIDRMIFFEVEAAPNPVRVQAQVLLTRRLFYAPGVQVYGNLPEAPVLAGALVIPLGDSNMGNQWRNGTAYGVLEQRYALFPEQSGHLRIPEAAVLSAVRLPGGGRRSGIRASAAAVDLQVLPIPAEYPADRPWLPAASLSISESWTPNEPGFKVGEPLQRIVTVTATGNVAAVIPPLRLELPPAFFKHYPEPERLEDSSSPAGIQGARREAHSIIPVQPGEAVLPALSVTWWDSANGRVREAVLAERRVRIVGEAPATSAPPLPAEEGSATAANAAETAGTAAPRAQPPSIWLLALAALGFIGWAATYFALRGRRPADAGQPKASAAERTAVSQARKALASACKKGDLEAMRNAWLAYLGAARRTSAPETLAYVKGHAAAKEMLDLLNARLYGDDQLAPINGQALLRLTRTLLEDHAEEQAAILPELHQFAPSKAP